MRDLNRRRTIGLIGGAAAVWPLAAGAQQPNRLRRVGVLMSGHTQTDREGQARVVAFLDTLRRLGWSQGRNIQIDYRWGGGKADPASTAELVRSAPDVIVAMGNPAVAEVKQLTSNTPVVFVEVGDSVGSGVVASAARPEGNITGFEFSQPSMGGKWLGVLKEAAPNMNRVAILFGGTSNNDDFFVRSIAGAAGR